jgi:beta-galactosidase
VEKDTLMLPRFGVEFRMPADCEYLHYFGKGPMEAYMDKQKAARLSKFSSTVTDHFEHYVRPQENMAHADTRWMFVSQLYGHGLGAVRCGEMPFSFNCAHYSPMQLTKTAHDYELQPLPETLVNIDYRHAGIGSNSCGPVLKDCWKLNEKQFSFSFRLLPMFIADTDPYQEIGKI